jgi:hypothetical protein
MLPAGELDEYLNGLDDWQLSVSQEADDKAAREQTEANEGEIQAKTKELRGDYFAAIEGIKEKEME